MAFFAHAAHGGQDDFFHGALIHLGRNNGRGAVCAHAAGIRAEVAVEQAFVVLAGGHRQHICAVHHHDKTGFLALQKVFNHHARAGIAHFIVEQHLVDGLVCLLFGLRHHHAFTGGQAVCLNHNRRAFGSHIIMGGSRIGKGLILRGGNAVPRHKGLGEIFGTFQLGGGAGGAEHGQAGGAEIVHYAGCQRCFGADHSKGNLLTAAEINQFLMRFQRQVLQLGFLCRTGIAGCDKHGLHFGRLRQLPRQRMLTPAAADNE